MEVIRKVKKEVKKVQVGDQVVLGRYTATCMTVDNTGATFCFDQVYGDTPIKEPWNLNRVKTLYRSKAMDSVRDFLIPFEDGEGILNTFRSPTAEEVAPKTNLRAIEPTTISNANKRWEPMKNGYRIALDVNGNLRNYWVDSLVNPNSQEHKTEGSHVYVTTVGTLAAIDLDQAKYIFWRPVFKLKV